jgi:FkbM family methyltransferase
VSYVNITRGNRVIRMSEQHASYVSFLERYFDTYYDAVIPVNIDGMEVADFSQPKLHTYRHNNLQFYLSSLPEEPEVVDAYFRHCRGDALAFDVGAYCGLSTYELSRRFKQVIAFEPDTANRACLIANMLLHKLTNVTTVPLAMAPTTGNAVFFKDGSPASRLAMAEYKREPLVTVQTISLTDACAEYGVPDFIVMDIEGAEVEVLESSYDILTRHHPSMVIDTNHGNTSTAAPVTAALKLCRYRHIETDVPGGFFTTFAWGK